MTEIELLTEIANELWWVRMYSSIVASIMVGAVIGVTLNLLRGNY